MRVLVIIIVFFDSILAFSQRVDFRKLEAYNIQSSTPSVLKLINEQARKDPNYSRWLVRFSRRNGMVYPTKKQVNSFLEANGKIIKDVSDHILMDQSVLVRISNELNKANPSVAVYNYETIFPSADLKRFYQQAIVQAAVYYQDTLYYEYISTNELSIDKIVADRLNIIYSITRNEFKNLNKAGFSNLFSDDVGELRRLDLANPFDKQIVDYAFNYYLLKKPNLSLTKLTSAQIANLSPDVEKRFEGFRVSASKSVHDEFTNLTETIQKLSANQKLVTDNVSVISGILESDIKRIQVIKADGNNATGVISAKVDAEVKLLNNRITYLTDFVNSVTQGNIDYEKLQKNLTGEGIVRAIFPTEYAVIEKGIKLVSETPTLTNTIEFASGVIAIGQQFGVDKKAIQGVNRFVNYAKAAVQVGTGIARLACGDITGLFSAFSGIGSLFGGGGPPPDSPELQFMKGMAEEMRQSFKEINDKLDDINKKLVTLQRIIVDGFKEAARHFDAIEKELEFQRFLLEGMDAKLTYSIYSPFNSCDLIPDKDRTLDDWISLYNETQPPLPSKLLKCSQFLIDPVNPIRAEIFAVKFTTNLGGNDAEGVNMRRHYQKLYDDYNQQYQNTFEYFKQVYKGDESHAITSLLFPVNQANQNHIPYYLIKQNRIPALNLRASAIGEPIDCKFLNRFADKYLDILDYYLINNSFRGDSRTYLNNLLSEAPNDMIHRKEFASAQLDVLRSVCTKAMIQEAIISGQSLLTRARYTLSNFGAPPNETSLLDNVISQNQIFSRNLSVLLLNEFISSKSDYRSIIEQFGQDPAGSVSKLNQLITDRVIVNRFEGSDVNDIVIHINFFGRTIRIKAPTPEELELNRMTYTPGYYLMLELRDKLNKMILDLKYLERVPNKGPLNSKNVTVYFLNSTN